MATSSDTGKEMNKWQDMRLAERMAQLAHSISGRRILDRLATKTQNGTLGKPDSADDADSDMNMQIGDNVNHYHPKQGGTQNDWLKKAAVTASLLLGGVGVGAAAVSMLSKGDAMVDTDTDTQYELGIGSE